MVIVTTELVIWLRSGAREGIPLICSASGRTLASAAMLPPAIARPNTTAPISLFIIVIVMIISFCQSMKPVGMFLVRTLDDSLREERYLEHAAGIANDAIE